LASSKRIATGVGPGPSCKPASLDPRGYKPVKPRILNTGVGTMQANFEKGSQTMFCGGLELELLQFHFHTPSEHAFDGERAAMEVHLVHRNIATGEAVGIGVWGRLVTARGGSGLAAGVLFERGEAANKPPTKNNAASHAKRKPKKQAAWP
jgi:hypothetical protein